MIDREEIPFIIYTGPADECQLCEEERARSIVTGTDGRNYVLDAEGVVIEMFREECYDDGPTCSICDALGHGYPGGGPCPLEMADYSGEPRWAV